MTRRRITAVELDTALDKLGDALAALTPEERAGLRADMPTDIVALGDQAGAAQGQAIGLFLDAGDRGGLVPRDQVDEWIRLSALDALIAWIDGKGRTCMHAPHWRRPEPVFSCAWRPGLVVCAQCLHLLDAVGDADKTCDRCGHICAGVDDGDAVYTSTVLIGALAHMFGVCSSCRPDFSSEGVA